MTTIEFRLQLHPIDTAPKDRQILLCKLGKWVSAGRWDDQPYHKKPRPLWIAEKHHYRMEGARADQPTHWMELPKT